MYNTADAQNPIDKRNSKRHGKKLNRLVSKFCAFLDSRPQPSGEDVRKRFVRYEMDWKIYCISHHLGIKASMLFNAKVAYEWETRYVKPDKSMIRKGTQK